MHAPLRHLAVGVLFALAPATALGERGMEREHLADLGLQPRAGAITLPADLAFRGEAAQVWQARRGAEYSLYAGARETARLGLRAEESYGGIVYSLPGGLLGSSLEAGYAPQSLMTPRRYALTGQLHAALGEGRSFSVGLKYRVDDPDTGSRIGAAMDASILNGYALAASRQPGAVVLPYIQLQMSYQYSPATSFGLALGRDVETFTPVQDPAAQGPRQYSFTGQHWLTPSWALSYDVLTQDPATPLRSLGLRLGVRYRF